MPLPGCRSTWRRRDPGTQTAKTQTCPAAHPAVACTSVNADGGLAPDKKKANALSPFPNTSTETSTNTPSTTSIRPVRPTMPPTVKIAACHASPVYLDAAATTQKALSLIDAAAAAGAHLVVFPEVYIPGFPVFAGVLAPVDQTASPLFTRYIEQSVYADGPEITAVRNRARERGVAVSMGFSERSRRSVGAAWNSNVLIAETGEVLAHHRKLAPTYWEKLVWAPGDGLGLVVGQTARAGRVGALICGENTNPLARFAMMAQAEQVHVACFPPAWPTKRVAGYANRTANAVRGAAHSFEAKCFTVVVSAFFDEETKRIVAGEDEEVRKCLENAPQAATQFFAPDGTQFGEERIDDEGIAYAECDLARCLEGKQLHDVTGGYQRYDVFELKVTRKRDEPVEWR